MNTAERNITINWYRSPVDRDLLAQLNQRSDVLGLLQTLGHLGIIATTGVLAFFALASGNWLWIVPALFAHGTVFAFLLNGFHELCHKSVFRSRWLNVLFLNVISFISASNPVMFWTSHQEHHKFTLHQPDDLEVVLPVEITWRSFWTTAVVNPIGAWKRLQIHVRHSRGLLRGAWEEALFPARAPERLAQLARWARIILFGHAAIAVVSIALGLWQLPILITLAPFYGGLLLYLCNNTQHVGLQDDVSDYRLCVRTIYLNPIVQFLYWHMNFHIEHHMYAMVPCYNLGRLHAAIKSDLPECPNGLYATWHHIIGILRKQRVEPEFQFAPVLPSPATG